MGTHIDKDGFFQSDKYPTCPPGKVPLSVKDPMAQDLLFEYAQRRRSVDPEFSADLEMCLKRAGYTPDSRVPRHLKNELHRIKGALEALTFQMKEHLDGRELDWRDETDWSNPVRSITVI